MLKLMGLLTLSQKMCQQIKLENRSFDVTACTQMAQVENRNRYYNICNTGKEASKDINKVVETKGQEWGE